MLLCHFFFNDTATTEIYTLSLHDALPIYVQRQDRRADPPREASTDRAQTCASIQARTRYPLQYCARVVPRRDPDRKSTRLNSSHANISYAVFCLKKKKIT